jgi:hypothetical protein
MENRNVSTELAAFEQALTNKLIQALKAEFVNGDALGESLENLILVCNEIGTEEMGCYGLYVNSTTFSALSPEQLEQNYSNNNSGMLSMNWFQSEIYSDNDGWRLVDIFGRLASNPIDLEEEPEWPIILLLLRICSKLEKDRNLLEGIPVGENFLIFINDSDYILFKARRKANECAHLPIVDYLKRMSDT